MRLDHMPRAPGVRGHLVPLLFGLLYRNRVLYQVASTVPFAGQWRRWQRLVLPRLHGRAVLEIGCGIGTLLGDMVAAGYDCRAIDRSPQMVAATRRTLRRRGLSLAPRAVRQADARCLPYPAAHFDSVVSTFPTAYIMEARVAREIARVLRPGGRLIVVLDARLLPSSVWLLPLVAVQRLVYGPADAASLTCALAYGSTRLPLAEAGLRVRDECVRGPFWLASLAIAEKPALVG